MKLKSILRQISAVSLLFPLMLLTGCSKTQTEYEAVKVPNLPLPLSLLSSCNIPEVPEAMTYADSVLLNLTMQGALEDCNAQIAGIRSIEEARQK